ncbi:hypothetical protein GA0061098_1016157 [Bradyrhizobium shewense]|uniref:Novel STAND NTPase 1 domain-containing protein n=1 Tax=Bradyrhizobium shewense TaxID=1761772 RepID=A0A1C3XJ47_9BRAD|nr:hypothetical protein [Bradyrhizobium shewense]SCB52086.1 hypothetical protein GA0061098_1016157 [Bradyrhizobium shewense]
MGAINLNDISGTVGKTEASFVWLIRDVWRGTWFRRLILLFVLCVLLGNPKVAGQVASLLIETLPSWYTLAWAIANVLLFALCFIVGVRTIPPRELPPSPIVNDGVVRGLLPFNKENGELFAQLGRAIELQRIIASLRDPDYRFGILVGASGTGKTSFLRAGLLPYMEENKMAATYVELSDEDPMISIKRGFASQGQTAPSGFLLLDQFEQFFLHQATADDRRPLVEAINAWYRRDSGVRILIAIRAEDAWQMLEIQETVNYQLSNQNYFKLSKFSPAQAVEVLKILCQKAGIDFDPVFAAKIVDKEFLDAEDGLVSPVNLGIVVLVLATGRRQFTEEGFSTQQGGIDGVLEEWLGSQVEAARYQGLEGIVVRVLAALCDFDRNRRAGILSADKIAERLGGDVTPNRVHDALRWLKSRNVRLVVAAGQRSSGTAGYQLAHERLIPAIRKLAGTLFDDASRANDLLERRTRAWVGNNRKSRFLLTFFEDVRVERQRPYLIWGENRQDKEEFLRRSRVRWRFRGAMLAAVLLVAVVGYGAWTLNPVQRSYLRWELSRLARIYPTSNSAVALAAGGYSSAAQEVAGKVDADDPDDLPNALSDTATTSANAGLASGNESLIQTGLGIARGIEDDEIRTATLSKIAISMQMAATATGKKSYSDQALTLADSLNEGDWRKDFSIALAHAVVVTGDKALLQRAKSFADGPTEVPWQVARAIFKLGLSSNDTDLLAEGQKLIAPLRYTEASAALRAMAQDAAKAEKTKLANDLLIRDWTMASSLKPKERSEALGQIILLLTQLGLAAKDQAMLENAKAKAAKLSDEDRDDAMHQVAKAIASYGLAVGDDVLITGSQDYAEQIGDKETRGEALQDIAVMMAISANIKKNARLLERAQELAGRVRWKERPWERWKIAIGAGDTKMAQRLLTDSIKYINVNYQGHGWQPEFLYISGAMQAVGSAFRDPTLLMLALDQVNSFDSSIRIEPLIDLSGELAKVGEIAKAKDVLEKALLETERLRSETYYSRMTSITERMVKLGDLKRAREIAESAGGSTVPALLSAIVLTEVSQTYPLFLTLNPPKESKK